MPRCWFVLLRFWLRVDHQLVRLRDVRYFCKLDAPGRVLREIKHVEALFSELGAAEGPNANVRTSATCPRLFCAPLPDPSKPFPGGVPRCRRGQPGPGGHGADGRQAVQDRGATNPCKRRRVKLIALHSSAELDDTHAVVDHVLVVDLHAQGPARQADRKPREAMCFRPATSALTCMAHGSPARMSAPRTSVASAACCSGSWLCAKLALSISDCSIAWSSSAGALGAANAPTAACAEDTNKHLPRHPLSLRGT